MRFLVPEGVSHVLLHLGVLPQHHLDELVEVDGAVAVLVHVSERRFDISLTDLLCHTFFPGSAAWMCISTASCQAENLKIGFRPSLSIMSL